MTSIQVAQPAVAGVATKPCILVVEDELLIRVVLSDELREAGHDVIEACDADEALTLLKARVHVDLVISDVRMPGSVDGMGLLAEIKSILPQLPVILTSGHLEAALALANGAVAFFPKPYALDAVLGATRRTLGETA